MRHETCSREPFLGRRAKPRRVFCFYVFVPLSDFSPETASVQQIVETGSILMVFCHLALPFAATVWQGKVTNGKERGPHGEDPQSLKFANFDFCRLHVVFFT